LYGKKDGQFKCGITVSGLKNDNNDIIYTAKDIEKYHKGLLTSREMHALEKAALDDPFLADALEGYRQPGLDANAAMGDLQSRLASRIQKEDAKVVAMPATNHQFYWWKIAAMLIVVAGAAFLTYRFAFDNGSREIAQSPKNQTATPPPNDTQSAEITDDNLVDSAPVTSQPIEQKTKRNDERVQSAPGQKTDAPSSSNTAAARINEASATTDEAVQPLAAEEKENIASAQRQPIPGKAVIEGRRRESEQAAAQMDSAKARAGYFSDMAAKKKEALPPRHVFKGRITDASNNPLPFTNVTNIEDNIGTYSDAKGNFVLTSTDSLLKVQVSAVGFETSLAELHHGIPTNSISLKEDLNIPEVVIARSKVNTRRIRLFGNKQEVAEPQDGWDNYDTYLVNNNQLPAFIKNQDGKSMGEVELSFEVDNNGKPQNIAVSKSLCSSCDEEAIRLVKEGPRWKRKSKKGKATVNIAF
jgi:hypothetical protein